MRLEEKLKIFLTYLTIRSLQVKVSLAAKMQILLAKS